MDTPDASNIPRDPVDAAAYWFTRDHGGLMTASERLRFEAWREADPAHERAFQEMTRVWAIARKVPDRQLRRFLQHGRATRALRPDRRQAAWRLGAALCAVAAAGVVASKWWPEDATFAQHYATGRGERSRIVLPDASTIALNTATQAAVRFTPGERQVALLGGEIMFEVAPDQAWPFIIETGLGRIRVTGTRFDVRYDGNRLAVAVESGSVEVSGGPWWKRRRALLTGGQGVRIDGRDDPLQVERVDAKSLTAWRQGKAVFDNTPLSMVVSEINRYRDQPIHVAPELRDIRIAGVFDVDNTGAFLKVLPALVPVRVVMRADGSSEIIAK